MRATPELEILSQTPYTMVNKERKLVASVFVVYRDKDMHVGTLVIPKGKVTEKDVLEELAKRKAGP